jgi:hypothetical protein
MAIDKSAVLAALRRRVEADLEAIVESQLEIQAGATHEESRAENDKDTRALESTYLARGLAERVAALQTAASVLANLQLRSFDDQTPTALTALISIEDDCGAIARYFVAPAGGGLRVEVAAAEVRVVTPQSPLGRALMGKRCDDEIELRTGQGAKLLTVVDVC